MRVKEIREDGKILVLSDIHYPYCNSDVINSILEREKPSLTVLLGDIIVSGDEGNFFKMFRGNVIYVKGDEDIYEGDVEVLKVRHGNKKYIFLHGHQFFSERSEYRFAKYLKKVNDNLPPLLFCLIFRLLLHESGALILGHSHALRYFKSLRCVNAGTLTLLDNLYHDQGYVVINDNEINIRKI